MESKQAPVNYKDILLSFVPLVVAILAQYVINFIDVIILFLGNMHSSEKTYTSMTIEAIMKQDYNQPMNLAYMTFAQHVVFLVCFGIWYYKAFYKKKQEDGYSITKKSFLCLRNLYIVLAGLACQVMMDGILTMVRPCFPTVFAEYDQLVSRVSGANSSTVMLLAVVLLAPLGEELLFRGVIQGYAHRYMPAGLAILFQGALFGMYHGNIVQGIYATVLGCVLGFVAYKTNSLIPTMLLHLCINASLLIVPTVWFEDTTRCIILTIASAAIFILMIWLVVRRKTAKTKNKHKAKSKRKNKDKNENTDK